MNIYVIWRLSGHGLGAPPPTQAHLWARKVTAEFNAQRYKKMLGLVFPIACFFLTSGLARGTPQASAHIRGLSRPRQLRPSHVPVLLLASIYPDESHFIHLYWITCTQHAQPPAGDPCARARNYRSVGSNRNRARCVIGPALPGTLAGYYPKQ